MRKLIKLTEEHVRLIVESLISERLGVPSNITETAEQILEQIKDEINRIKHEEIINPNEDYDYSTLLTGDYNISDYFFNQIDLKISARRHIYPNARPTLASATAGFISDIKGTKLVKVGEGIKFSITMLFAVGTNWNLEQLLESLNTDRESILSVLTHELEHAYKSYKEPSASAESRSSYNAAQIIEFNNIPPIRDFFFYSYYIHQVENSTRPSEFYSRLKSQNITKKQFMKFYEKSDIVETLKRIKNFRLSKLISDLHNYIPQIDDIFHKLIEAKIPNIQIYQGDDENQKIDAFLNIIYELINRVKSNTFFDILKRNIGPLDALFNPQKFYQDMKDNQKIMDNYIKKIEKYKNYQNFFGNEEKRFIFVADGTLRKLGKLYDMAKDDLNEEKSSMIVDWDLYHKINKTSEKTLEEIKKMLHDMSKDDKDYPFLIKDNKKTTKQNKKPSK